METLRRIEHPLIEHHLCRLRDESTSPSEFRRSAATLSTLLAFEATRGLATERTRVRTPLTETDAWQVVQRIGLVPVLRAGLLMVDPLQMLIPEAEVWHLGIFRDESTAQPVHYYDKLPADRPVDVALVLDPMLATGGTASLVIERLRRWGVPSIAIVSLIASPEGIAAVQGRYPEVSIFTCAVDSHLDSRKYIVPGLGDAGDRGCNTLRD